jgi:hypothetical protein
MSQVEDEARHESFDGFLKAAIKDYYARGWKARKGNFVALLLASGQSMSMLGDSVKDGAGIKKAAVGAVSVVALRYALRYLVGGPIGILLSAAAVASLIAYFIKNKDVVAGKVTHYKDLIAEHRLKYEEVQGGYRDSRYQAGERNLMIDGMLKRFLDQLDAP